jgi:hypothetical protein
MKKFAVAVVSDDQKNKVTWEKPQIYLNKLFVYLL